MSRNASKRNNDDSPEVIDIPLILLDDRIESEAKIALVPVFAQELGLDFEHALHFINGLQSYLSDMEHEKSGYFKFKLDSVELVDKEIKRNGKPFVLGRKARLNFVGTNYRTKKEEDQFIETGWIEFFGYGPETVVFEMAAANKLYEIAQELEGETVVARKHMVDGEENMFRYLGHIRKGYDNDGDDGDGGSSSRRRGSGSGSRRRKSSWPSDIDEAIEKFDKDEDLEDEDIDFLHDLGDSTESDIKSAIKEYLDVPTSKLGKVDAGDNLAEYAVELLLESID